MLLYLFPMGRGQVSLFCSTRGVCDGLWFCMGCWEGPASHGRLMATVKADLALSLRYVTFFSLSVWLCCFSFFLVTLIPRCSGQKYLDFYSWSQATEAVCWTDLPSFVSPHRSLLQDPEVTHLCLQLVSIQKSFGCSQVVLGQVNSARLCKTPFASAFPHARFFSWILLLPGFSTGSVLSILYPLGFALGCWVGAPVITSLPTSSDPRISFFSGCRERKYYWKRVHLVFSQIDCHHPMFFCSTGSLDFGNPKARERPLFLLCVMQ